MASARHRASAFVWLLVAACHNEPPPAAPAPAVATRTASAEPADAPAQRIPVWPAYLGARFDPGTTKITAIIPNSPAADSPLHLGDEVVSIDGVAMSSSRQIVQRITETQANSTIKMVIKRGEESLTFTIKLGARPSDENLIKQTLLDKPAPPFSATMADGSAKLTLASLKGKVVIVDFWATWCHPCIAQIPHLNELHNKYASQGLKIVALSNEEPDVVRDFIKSEKLVYSVGFDPDDKIRAAYIVPGMPTTLVIDKTGIVRYVSVGFGNMSAVEAAVTKLLK